MYVLKLKVFLILNGCIVQSKVVSQGRQPTDFHLEDRGPEIQIKSTAIGTIINAIPAGLSVLAKASSPGSSSDKRSNSDGGEGGGDGGVSDDEKDDSSGKRSSDTSAQARMFEDAGVGENEGVSFRPNTYAAPGHDFVHVNPWLTPPQRMTKSHWEMPPPMAVPQDLEPPFEEFSSQGGFPQPPMHRRRHRPRRPPNISNYYFYPQQFQGARRHHKKHDDYADDEENDDDDTNDDEDFDKDDD